MIMTALWHSVAMTHNLDLDTWRQFLVTLFFTYNTGIMVVQYANVVLTWHNYTWFSLEFTRVFSAYGFQTLHILFKIVTNVSLSDRTTCKDIYNFTVFDFLPLWSHSSGECGTFRTWTFSNIVLGHAEVSVLCGIIFN